MKPRSFFCLAAVLASLNWSSFALAQQTCRQALALGLDVSGSVDAQEYRLQMDGVAGALSSPQVLELVLGMPSAPIYLAVFEWSDPTFQRVVVPWSRLSTATDVRDVATQLRATKRIAAPPSTALGQAMNFGGDLLSQQSNCWTRTLDISGDGKSNTGPRPKTVQNWKSTQNITINGLVIGSDPQNFSDTRQIHIGELQAYFEADVIKGPGAFVETALGFKAYQAAMTAKLLRELQSPNLSLDGSKKDPLKTAGLTIQSSTLVSRYSEFDQSNSVQHDAKPH